MRFDTPIYFQSYPPTAYDETTGDYVEVHPDEVMRYADVTDTRTDVLQIVYGDLRQGSKTIRIQNSYTDEFDRIRIGDKRYRVDYSRTLRTKETFVVSEVQ